jgi:hypothetical protein
VATRREDVFQRFNWFKKEREERRLLVDNNYLFTWCYEKVADMYGSRWSFEGELRFRANDLLLRATEPPQGFFCEFPGDCGELKAFDKSKHEYRLNEDFFPEYVRQINPPE